MVDIFKYIHKKKIPFLGLFLLVVFMWTGCSVLGIEKEPQPSEVSSPAQEVPPIEEPPRIEEVRIGAVGDVMGHMPQIHSAYVGGEQEYDFYPVFQPIEKYIKEADIAIANLETTFSGKEQGFSGYPMFNSPEQLGEGLKLAGFDILSTANNHSLDRRSHGVKSTLDFLDEQGLAYTGTARSQEERDELLIKEVNDIRIAFLAYTYGTNGIPIPEDQPYLVNLIDKDLMAKDIQRAKEEKVDIIVASMHFGNEYQRGESEEQRQLVDFLFEQGVDVVLGSHPHVIQPMEIRNVTTIDGEEKEAFVIYSLGNFVSNQRERYRDSGLILHVSFEKNFDTNEISLTQVEYIPTWVRRSTVGGKTSYHVLGVEEAMLEFQQDENGFITRQDYEFLQRAWKDTTEHLEQDNVKMVVKPIQ